MVETNPFIIEGYFSLCDKFLEQSLKEKNRFLSRKETTEIGTSNNKKGRLENDLFCC